jgi:ubiquinone/menaquinone biosynthesis C-methylase UbiE
MQRSILLIFIFIIAFIEAKCKLNETSRKSTSSSTDTSDLFDKSDRARQLQLRRVLRDLKIRRNLKVADIGADGGWLTIRLATFVGSKGKVYAVDIVPSYVSYIKEQIKMHKLNNVEVILGSAIDPKLPENTLDAAMILIAYHEFEKPITMLTKIRKAMKAGARLGIIDRDTDQMRKDAREAYAKTGYISDRVNETLPDNFITNEHYLALDIIIRETTLVGFKFLFSRELGGDYYIAIFANS